MREEVQVPALRRRLDEVRVQHPFGLVAGSIDVAHLDGARVDEAVDDRALDTGPLGIGRPRLSVGERALQVARHQGNAQRA